MEGSRKVPEGGGAVRLKPGFGGFGRRPADFWRFRAGRKLQRGARFNGGSAGCGPRCEKVQVPVLRGVLHFCFLREFATVLRGLWGRFRRVPAREESRTLGRSPELMVFGLCLRETTLF